MASEKRAVHTDQAPAAIGPYAQAIVYDKFVFVSGQLPIDPKTGQLIPGGPGEQTRQAMENIKAILEASGSSLERVLKATIYVKDLSAFDEVNRVYGSYFQNPPARACVEVARLPRDAQVEIEVVAALN